MRVVVCGSRSAAVVPWGKRVFTFLSDFHKMTPITELIHGNASGIDYLAGKWARYTGVKETKVPVKMADWRAQGKKAGNLRNGRMVAMKPDVVIAFPGGNGTADMCEQAREAGIRVIKVK